VNASPPAGLRQRLRAGGNLTGTFVGEAFGPAVPGLVAAAGGDFCVFDLEHGMAEPMALRASILACRAYGLAAIVRIAATEPALAAAALDAGADGILAPSVQSVDQAAALSAFCRYPPHGRRGGAFGIGHDDYRSGNISAAICAADARVAVLCMIESPEGLDAVEAIAALPDIDGCWFGYIDFSIAAGMPGAIASDPVRQAGRRIQDACAAAGKAAGIMIGQGDEAKDWAAAGYRLIAWSSDLQILRDGLRHGIATCRDALNPSPDTLGDDHA
jgi:2-keto-3-deoxy-L-rhamnonate aldolase RhmA